MVQAWRPGRRGSVVTSSTSPGASEPSSTTTTVAATGSTAPPSPTAAAGSTSGPGSCSPSPPAISDGSRPAPSPRQEKPSGLRARPPRYPAPRYPMPGRRAQGRRRRPGPHRRSSWTSPSRLIWTKASRIWARASLQRRLGVARAAPPSPPPAPPGRRRPAGPARDAGGCCDRWMAASSNEPVGVVGDDDLGRRADTAGSAVRRAGRRARLAPRGSGRRDRSPRIAAPDRSPPRPAVRRSRRRGSAGVVRRADPMLTLRCPEAAHAW